MFANRATARVPNCRKYLPQNSPIWFGASARQLCR